MQIVSQNDHKKGIIFSINNVDLKVFMENKLHKMKMNFISCIKKKSQESNKQTDNGCKP